MHAVVATVRVADPGAARAALADLRLGLVPRAPALAYPLPPLPGVTPLTAEIREVYASA